MTFRNRTTKVIKAVQAGQYTKAYTSEGSYFLVRNTDKSAKAEEVRRIAAYSKDQIRLERKAAAVAAKQATAQEENGHG